MRKLEIAIAGLSGFGLLFAIVAGATQHHKASQDALAPEDVPVHAVSEPDGFAGLGGSGALHPNDIAPAAGRPR